jgi:serine/threonine-protein kinase
MQTEPREDADATGTAPLLCGACGTANDEAAVVCFSCGRTLVSSAVPIVQGTVIAGRYEVLGLLGRGGMGTVYKAHDRVLDETVAFKVLRPGVAREADIQRRFRSEIKLARQVRHEHVCGIHEHGEEGGLRFIAMEYVDGVDLRRLLREQGPLPLAHAFGVSIQVADGLQAIHEAGIIHRDLKTSNIMIDRQGRVRLMDFGIAKRQGAQTTLGGGIFGTPEYMSPEQARGSGVEQRSDIYALGIVIHEVFTGRVPFRAETPIATILMQLNDPPPLDQAAARGLLPPPLVPVLRKALEKDVALRHATARELGDELQRARLATGITPVERVQVALSSSTVRTLPVGAASPWSPTHAADAFEGSARLVRQTGPRPPAAAQGAPAHEPPPLEPRPTPRRGSVGTRGQAPMPWLAIAIGSFVAAGAALVSYESGGRAALSRAEPDARTPGAAVGQGQSAATPATRPTEPPLLEPAPSGTTATPAPTGRRSPSPARREDPRHTPAAAPAAGEPAPAEAPLASAPPRVAPAPAASVPAPAGDPPPAESAAPAPRAEPAAAIVLKAADPRLQADPANAMPRYPQELRDQGVEGVVLLKVRLSRTGGVDDVQPFTGDSRLAALAIEAVRGWRYAPVLVDGEPVDVNFIARIPFSARSN